jgi:hypothetical protein
MKKLLKKVRLSSAHIYKNTIQPPHTRAAPLPLYPSSPRLSSSLLFSPPQFSCLFSPGGGRRVWWWP